MTGGVTEREQRQDQRSPAWPGPPPGRGAMTKEGETRHRHPLRGGWTLLGDRSPRWTGLALGSTQLYAMTQIIELYLHSTSEG